MNYPYQTYSNMMGYRYPGPNRPPRPGMGPGRPGQDQERFGFLGPFILGGITGGLLAPAFTPRPYYYNNYYYPPYYYYRPY